MASRTWTMRAEARRAMSGVSAVLAVALAAGCATRVPPPQPPDEAAVSLARVLKTKRDLPEHSDHVDAKATPAVMDGAAVTIRGYVGDASNLLSRVAKARAIGFDVTGPEPRLPLFVAVDVDGVPFERFLADVAHQFGQRANLVLTDRGIEIRYRGQP